MSDDNFDYTYIGYSSSGYWLDEIIREELLIEAARDGRYSEVQRFLARGVNVNGRNDPHWKTPLFMACESGYLEVAELLIENGAVVDAVYIDDSNTNFRFTRKTPLHAACQNGYRDTALLLIANGADIHAKDARGFTPLHDACRETWLEEDCFEVVRLLIENGAEVMAKTDFLGSTPLHLACSSDRLEITRLLIENGADINATDDNGKTPLYCACHDGRLEAVQLLVNRGANVSLKTAMGLTGLQIAAQRNHANVVWFLVRRFPWLFLE